MRTFTAHRGRVAQGRRGMVSEAKSRMTPPQDVIAILKAHVQREAHHMWAPRNIRRSCSLVVGWGIEEYYRER